MTDKAPDYEVGYKKTPTASRYKPGQSGNPKGRPKSAENFNTAFEKELSSTVTVSENGKRRKIPKRAAIAKQQVIKALSGDHKATTLVLAEARQREPDSNATSIPAAIDKAEDRLVMESIVRRIQLAATSASEIAEPMGPQDFTESSPTSPIEGDKK